MLFAPRNASVVEFGLKPHVDRCFGHMALALGLDYWLVPQVSAFIFANYTLNEDSVDAVMRLLRHIAETKGLHHLLKDPPSLDENV